MADDNKAFLNVVLETLRTANLPDVKPSAIGIHAGKFTWAELKRRGFASPAVFITCSGWNEASAINQAALQGCDAAFHLQMFVGVAARHAKSAESRNAIARGIATAITSLLVGQGWHLDNALEPESIRAQGLFIPDAESENQSLWLVSWVQPIGIKNSESSFSDWLSYRGESTADTGDQAIIETQGTLPGAPS